ncbi:MAG: TatD family hydrolase [Kiritimatiellae bacterium]|nr:TatD family hydrolase [Kiritimatiellia bacterium]
MDLARILPRWDGLWDCHAHLQDAVFDGRHSEILARARAAGVARIVVNGTSPDDWPAVAALAERFPEMVLPAYGVHPLYVNRAAPGWHDELRRRLEADPRASVGEIGLDRAGAAGPIELQLDLFERQVRLAIDLQRPFTVHCRRAWDLMRARLESLAPFAHGFVLHSYGGGAEQVRSLAALGAYFSFSGTLTWPRNRRGPAAVVLAPPDRLLAETDAPDLPPWREATPSPQLPNEPANLPRVVERIAELRGGTTEEWAARLAANAHRCFNGE